MCRGTLQLCASISCSLAQCMRGWTSENYKMYFVFVAWRFAQPGAGHPVPLGHPICPLTPGTNQTSPRPPETLKTHLFWSLGILKTSPWPLIRKIFLGGSNGKVVVVVLRSKLHIFVPSGPFGPRRSIFPTQKRCFIALCVFPCQ